MMQQTSLDIWHATIKRELPKRQQAVLEIIEEFQPISLHQVARKLDTFPHVISGRITELKDKRRIEEAYRAMGETNKKVIYWKVRSNGRD